MGKENPKSLLSQIKTKSQFSGLKPLSSSAQAPSRIFLDVTKSLGKDPPAQNPIFHRLSWKTGNHQSQPSYLGILFRGLQFPKGISTKSWFYWEKHPSPVNRVNEAWRVLGINWVAIMQMKPELGQAERLPGATEFPGAEFLPGNIPGMEGGRLGAPKMVFLGVVFPFFGPI